MFLHTSLVLAVSDGYVAWPKQGLNAHEQTPTAHEGGSNSMDGDSIVASGFELDVYTQVGFGTITGGER